MPPELDPEFLRQLPERLDLIEKCLQICPEKLGLLEQQRNRDHAFGEGAIDVVVEFIATYSGISRETVRNRIAHEAAKHLAATLDRIQENDPGRAAALDDRDPGEIATD